MLFGTEKLEWCGYPTVKIFLILCLFVLTEFTNLTDTHTQIDRHYIGRTCIASHGKIDMICHEKYILFPHVGFHACSNVRIIVEDSSYNGKEDLAVERLSEASFSSQLTQLHQ